MEQYLHQINSNRITTIDYSGNPETINNKNDHWLEVKIQSRQAVGNELKKYQFDSRILSQVEAPEAPTQRQKGT